MQCPFCSAANARDGGACRVCGGPLGGASFRPPNLRAEKVAPPAIVKRVVVPLPTPKSTAPAPPILVARHALEKNAPRIVSAMWGGEADAAFPIFATENGALMLWDVLRDKLHSFSSLRQRFKAPSPTTGAAMVSQMVESQSAVIAICRESGQICLQRIERDVERGAERDGWKSTVLNTIQAHCGRANSLAVAGARLYSAGSDGAVVLTLMPDAPGEGALDCKSQVILDGWSALCCLALSPDGRLLALGGDDGQVQMWHLEDAGTPARLDWTTAKSRAAIRSLGFSPNGNMLISHDAQGGCCLRAARSGHELQRMSEPLGTPAPVFAPDSRLLALANDQNGLDICDSWTGNLRHKLGPIEGSVGALAFSPGSTPSSNTAASETLFVVATSQQLLVWKVAF